MILIYKSFIFKMFQTLTTDHPNYSESTLSNGVMDLKGKYLEVYISQNLNNLYKPKEMLLVK
jgi:hypothetical protein